MLVRHVMESHPETISPTATVTEAARRMRDRQVGALLVLDGGSMVGLVTDRDLATRNLAEQAGPEQPVRDVMTTELICVRPGSPVERAEELMSEFQVKRLPVRDEGGLHGIVTQTDIALKCNHEQVGALLEARVYPSAPPSLGGA